MTSKDTPIKRPFRSAFAWVHLSLPVALTLLLSSCDSGPDGESTGPPNIVLVMADDQGWGDVGYNGNPVLKTPHLDALAASGLRFDRFYSAAPVCSPTRCSVLTGRHPNRFGCFSWGHTLRPQETTVAESLRQAGYVTGHFGKWHVGSVRSGSPVNPGASGFDEWLSSPNFFDNDPILSAKGRAVRFEGESSMVTVEAALEFIREAQSERRRFFAVVWFGSPHRPHHALEEDLAQYRDRSGELGHFYGEITGLDRAVGKLRESLADWGLRDNTLLWYLSDNGALPEGSTGGFRGHKGELYEGGLLVPAVIEWPRTIAQPRVTEIRANTSDIYPTLLEIAGVPSSGSPNLDGLSLLGVLEGKTTVRPNPMGFWSYPAQGIITPAREWMTELLDAQESGREPDDQSRLRLEAGRIDRVYRDSVLPGHAAWIDGDWKLHRIPGDSEETVRYELYNLARDPYERQAIRGDSDRLESMRAAMEAWQKSVVRSLNGEDY